MTTIIASQTPVRLPLARPAGPLAAGWLGLWGVLALVGTAHRRRLPVRRQRPQRRRRQPAAPGAGGPGHAALRRRAADRRGGRAGDGRPRGTPARPAADAAAAGYGWAVAFVLAVVVPDVRVLVILGYLPMLISVRRSAGRRSTTPRSSTGRCSPGSPPSSAGCCWPGRCSPGSAAPPGAACRLRSRRHRPGLDHPGRRRPLGPVGRRHRRGHPVHVRGDPVRLGGRHPARHLPGVPAPRCRTPGWCGPGSGWARSPPWRDPHPRAGAALGRRFPRWMLGLAGRRVPVKLAVVPATLVAIAVTAAASGLLERPEVLGAHRRAQPDRGADAALAAVGWRWRRHVRVPPAPPRRLPALRSGLIRHVAAAGHRMDGTFRPDAGFWMAGWPRTMSADRTVALNRMTRPTHRAISVRPLG